MAAIGVALMMTGSVFAANVAKIGEIEYATIDAAIAAWKPGEMIELLSDIERDSYFVFTQNTYALDGKGHTIKCTKAHSKSWKYFVNANAGTQTFKNIIIDGNGKVPFVMQAIDGGKLILENVTIKGAKTTTTGSLFSRSTSLGYGIHVNDGSVEAKNITITNCEVADVYQDGASSSFTLSGDNCNVNFIGSSSAKESVTSTAKGYYAYEVTYKSNLGNGMAKTISNKSLNGIIDQVQKSITTIVASFPISVEIKSATVKLLQDVVLAEVFTSNDTKLTINGNGKTITGTFKFSSTPSPISNAVIGNGSVLDCMESTKTGFSGVSVAENANIEILLPASADINSYSLPVALGTGAIANITVGDKKYIAKGDTIAPAEMLAQVGDTRYATLQEAIDAANGAVIQVLKDVALTSSLTVPAGKTLTLNLAGRKVTVSGADYALVNNGNLTIVDMGLVTVVAAEATIGDETAAPILIMAPSANDGVAVIDDATGGSIAGVQNNGTFALESGAVVSASASVPAIDNTANAVATITGGTVEGKLQSTDKDALTITGGSFTGESNVAEFVGGNYGVDSNGTVISYVAQLGETKYQTLQEAFAAAKEFDVVTVLDDAADVSDIAGYVAEGLFPISNGDKTYTLRAMPAATVEKLPAFTLTAERDAYQVWDGSLTEGATDRPLDIVMNFLANDDGKAEANESGFADWKCDFYLTFSDMADDSLVANECYLAGNYGGFGWIVIPADGTEIDNNATLPVVAAYDANITYRQVCETVKKFTAAIHVADAVMDANPDLKITLSLKMTNDKDPLQELVVGSYTYGVADLKGVYNPEVKVAENVEADDTFKATVGSALADAYQTAEGKLGVTVKEKGATFATIDVAAKDDYEIPEEGLEMTFPAASVADGGTAFIVHRHNGVLYVYSGVVEYGFVTYKNTLGFSEFTVGDAAALNAAIAKAEAGDTIKLMSDIALSLPIHINNNVVIDGNGHKITPASDFTADGHNAVIVFAPAASDYSASRNYSIKNLTVEGFSGLVRVLRANFCDSLVENCAFVDNSVSEGVITSSFGKTNVKGCTFEGNTSGFSIVSVGYDVSAGTELSVAIEDSKFTGNKAAIALVYAASSVVVTGNFFSGNTHSGDNANAAAVLAGPYTGKMNYTIDITENAFVDAFGKDGGEALPDVFAEDWSEQYGVSTSFDLSSNYWNGGEPNYAVSGTPTVDLTDYYTTYADGVLGSLTEVEIIVAKIGDNYYKSINSALAAAKAGDTITLLADATVAEEYEVKDMTLTIDGAATLALDDKLSVSGKTTINIACPMIGQLRLLDGAIIKDSTVSGHGLVLGRVAFRGDNTFALLDDYGNAYSTESAHWTVEPGATLTFTKKARWGCGYGDKATVLGTLADARTARETLTDDDLSFFAHGAVMMSNWDAANAITVKDAYAVIGSNNSFGNSSKSTHIGTFDILFENSVLDSSRITFYSAPSKTEFTFKGSDAKVGTFMTRDADSVFVLTNSVLLSTTTFNGTDEGNYHAGTLKLTDSELTYSAPWVLENGTVEMNVASCITAPAITGSGTIIVDASDFYGIPVKVIKADMSEFTGEVSVVGEAVYEIVDDGIVIKEIPPVAQIGDIKYTTLADAFAAAQEGDTVELLADASVEGTAQIPAGVTIKSNGYKILGSIRMLGDLTLDGALEITGGLWVGKAGETLSATLAGDKLTASYFMFQYGSYTIDADIDAVHGYFSFEGEFEVNSTITTSNTNGEPLWLRGQINLNEGASFIAEYLHLDNANTVLNVKKGASITAGSGVSLKTAGAQLYSSGDISGSISAIDGTTVSLTGGTYTQDVAGYCAEGYNSVKQPGKDLWQVGKLPNAEVINVGPYTVDEESYYIYNITNKTFTSGHKDEFDLQVTLGFIANDTVEEAAANAYGQYLTDFRIKIEGIKNGSFVADKDCYLAGYYPFFGGWVKVNLDGMTIENGVGYPVITGVTEMPFTYETICDIVKSFICGIHLSDEVLQANPNLKVSLELGLAETQDKMLDGTGFITVGDTYDYTAGELQEAVALTGADYFTTIDAAVAAALETGNFVKLVKDASLQGNLDLGGNLVLNLGGKELKANGKMLAITDAVVTITNGTLSGFSAANITLAGNAILTVTGKDVADSFRTEANYYVSQNANGTHSIMLKSAFRVFITMVDGEPRIGFFKDCDTERAPTAYAIKGATNLETPEWADVDYETATDAAAASELPLHWVRPVGSSAQSGIRFFKLSAE